MNKRRLITWIVPLGAIATWEGVMRLGLFPPSQSALPSAIAYQLLKLVKSGELTNHLAYSLYRLLSAIAFGTVAGATTGLFLASSRIADKLFSPTVQFLAGVPVIVWMPFWIVLLGTGEGFKIGLAASATYFLVHIHAFQATRVIAKRYLELSEIYEKSSVEKFTYVLFPSALPSILTAVRVGVAIGWIVIFFVEYAVSKEGKEGLGWFIADSRQNGRVEEEFAGMILLGITGFLLDRVIARAQKRLALWSDSREAELGTS